VSAAKHTPGPWTVQITGMRGSFHIPEAQRHEAAKTGDGVDGYTVSKANARLIAAAPDMLAALKAITEWFLIAHPDHIDCPICQAKTAIAKAEAA
jgi:hypothetical protein